MADITFPLYKDKASGHFLVLPIFINKARDLNPLILRAAIIGHPTRDITLWQGFDRNANWTHDLNFNEFRFWQQIGYRHNFKHKKFDRLGVHARIRVEERVLEGIGTLIRVRFRVGATLGLGKTKRWYLSAMDELLLHANEIPGREKGFSENRPFLGVGRRITPNIALEVGWQPSLINSADGKPDIFRQYLVTYLTVRIPYSSIHSKLFPDAKPKAKEQTAYDPNLRPLDPSLAELSASCDFHQSSFNNILDPDDSSYFAPIYAANGTEAEYPLMVTDKYHLLASLNQSFQQRDDFTVKDEAPAFDDIPEPFNGAD